MPNIIEYVLVYGDGRDDLVTNINKMLKKGYQPYENIVIRTYSSSKPDFYQAMVKYEEVTKNKL